MPSFTTASLTRMNKQTQKSHNNLEGDCYDESDVFYNGNSNDDFIIF